MFKKAQARIVTEPFFCVGLGTHAPPDVFSIVAGVPMPPTLELYSKEYTGAIPHDAFVYDEKAHAAYVRDNTPRPEPVREADWTEEDIKLNLGWTEAQLRSARASGFPAPTGHLNKFNEEGIPYARVMTWSPQMVRGFYEQMKSIGWR